MTNSTYNALSTILEFGALISLFTAILTLGGLVAGRRGPRRKRRAIYSAVFLALVPTFVFAHWYMTSYIMVPQIRAAAEAEVVRQRSEHEASTSVVFEGDLAPGFEVQDTNDHLFSLAEHRGSVVLINFFATWCGPCLNELPHIQKLWDSYGRNEKFQLLVIGREETVESLTEFRSQNDYTFPIAADPSRAVYSLYAEQSIPRTLLIGTDGKVLCSIIGFHPEELEHLEGLINRELNSAR